MKKTVFFGPFLGEFGWEYNYWFGWVRKVCRTHFQDYHKIACSFPGRKPFYPYVDEFWTLPQAFLELKTSAHAYITDGWRDGYPGVQHEFGQEVSLTTGQLEWKYREEPLPCVSIEQVADLILGEYRAILPADTRFFVPWKWNQCPEDDLEFGLKVEPGVKMLRGAFSLQNIPVEKQLVELLQASPAAVATLAQAVPEPTKLACIFPRHRTIRRPDKNWSKESYQELIEKLRLLWKDVVFVICGEPGGAYFVDGVPGGCIDLINVPPENRLDLQIAALRRSIIALGSISGAMLVAAGAGCPTVIWCQDYYVPGLATLNYMKTAMATYPDINPSVDLVVGLAEALRQNSKLLSGQVTSC